MSDKHAEALVELALRRQAEDDFYTFVKLAWPIVEGGKKLVDSWMLKAMAEHLEEVYYGRILRLLINLPPRMTKSTMVSVLFPVWCWIKQPSLQLFSLSYAERLAIRDNVKSRRLIKSSWFQKRWGDRFSLALDQDAKERVDNLEGGYRVVAGMDGSITGDGGDCLVSGTLVSTTEGNIPIEIIAKNPTKYKAISFDFLLDKEVESNIMSSLTRRRIANYEIFTAKGRSIRCTGNHKIYVEGAGFIPASELCVGQRVYCDEITAITVHGRAEQPVYDIQVKGTHNFFANGILVHNCIILDDPNNVRDQSETTLETSLGIFTDVLPTRFNDFKTGRMIVVQQRANEKDISGWILSNEKKEWVHLMLPMEFEESRRCVTVPLKSTNGVPWQDPRTEEGELLNPKRIGHRELKRLKSALGSEYTCTPYEAPILMGDLSLKPIGDLRIGDEVIGWALNEEPIEKSSKYGRQHLKITRVIDVFSSIKPIVKITLDSGEVIRCTPDHKWYVRWKSDRGHLAYQPAAVGRGLCRICPPKLQELSAAEERDAGWLAGFFDGEGSVSMCGKEAGYRASAAISFFQGAGRNKPLCDKLELILHRFGFEFHIYEDDRPDKKNCGMYPFRHYKIKSIGLPVFQKFLHTIQVAKWRQRMIDGALGAKFIRGHEKVISIEPDGEDIVYSLKTETGNYVVWGLASKNCAGQLQQRPAPTEGGMIKRAWWQPWKHESTPNIRFVIQAWDTATSEKAKSSYSACTTWGIFKDEHEHDSLILLSVWRKKVEFPDLYKAVQRMARDYRATTEDRPINERYAPDLILVEEKSSGIQLIQTLNKTGIVLVGWRPDKYGDKIERVRRVTHLMEAGRVYVPYQAPDFSKPRRYADVLITQAALWPKGESRDLVDTCSMVLQRVINSGWVLHPLEQEASQQGEWRREYLGQEERGLY